jgi:hypothetical protein
MVVVDVVHGVVKTAGYVKEVDKPVRENSNNIE